MRIKIMCVVTCLHHARAHTYCSPELLLVEATVAGREGVVEELARGPVLIGGQGGVGAELATEAVLKRMQF